MDLFFNSDNWKNEHICFLIKIINPLIKNYGPSNVSKPQQRNNLWLRFRQIGEFYDKESIYIPHLRL